ncbi:hypothetical protein DL96DRAFT_1618590, partial [Flagelloscypha sp. PMI_526]
MVSEGTSVQSAIDTLENIQITRYVSAAGVVVLLYDHLLTFEQEVNYVWKAKRSIARTLFLILRYTVPVFLLVYNATGLSGIAKFNLPDDVRFCKVWLIATACLGQITIGITNAIVLLRLWVIWKRDLLLMKLTGVGFVLCQLGSLAAVGISSRQLARALAFDRFQYICVLNHQMHIFPLWIPGLVFEVMVFLTAFVYWLLQPRAPDDAMTRALYRNGLMYFLVLFSLRLLNTVLAIVAPLSLAFVGIFFIWSACTLTTTRLVLNVRSYSASQSSIREPCIRDPNLANVPILTRTTPETRCTDEDASQPASPAVGHPDMRV